jgi:hypothetical protein
MLTIRLAAGWKSSAYSCRSRNHAHLIPSRSLGVDRFFEDARVQLTIDCQIKPRVVLLGGMPTLWHLLHNSGDFSEGYPHFLQEFAYCAFETDDDNEITHDDFMESLFEENGAFDQLGAKYFDKSYSTPASDDYRKVLDAMSDHDDSWVNRSTLISESGLKAATVDNALRALKLKDIIVQDDSRAGVYRLPTRSFAVWISLRKRAGVAE